MRSIKNIFRIILMLMAGLLICMSLAGISIYIFRDRIIGMIVNELNKYLRTEVTVKEPIRINMLEKFPHLAIEFRGVSIKETGVPKENAGELAKANHIFIAFNPLDLIQDKYEITEIYLEDAIINLRIHKSGKTNYDIIKSDSTSTTNSLSLDLRKIILKDVIINYEHLPAKQNYSLLSERSEARLKVKDDDYHIDTKGNLLIYDIKIDGQSYLANKRISINSKNTYLSSQQIFKIYPSEVHLQRSKFQVFGDYKFGKPDHIDLSIEGEKGNIQTILSLLPEKLYKTVYKYKSTGEIYFKGKIVGEISEKHNPQITIDFGFEKASFFHPELNGRIEEANLLGYFTNGKQKNTTTTILRLTKVNAEFEGKRLEGNFLIKNFDDPYLELFCKGALNLNSLNSFYPIPYIKDVKGSVMFNFEFNGKTADLKKASNHNKITTSGEIQLQNFSCAIRSNNVRLNNINGNFLFNRNDVAVTDFGGEIEQNDFLLNGYFRNLIGKIIYNKQPMVIDAHLRSKRLNIDELMNIADQEHAQSDKGHSERSSLGIYYLNISCDIDALKYHKFDIKKLTGKVQYKDPSCKLTDIRMQVAGGELNFSSDILLKTYTEIHTITEFKGVKADSLFYIFDNFDQDFIQNKNLKGSISGTAELFTPLNKNGDVLWPHVYGNIRLNVKNGELNNFAPMQKLSAFAEDQQLANIKFSELSNEIMIKNNQIILPEMKIRSNVANIDISGTHTFENYLDYKMAVPLKNFKRTRDKDEQFGAIEDDGRGNPLIYLTIKGHVDNYKIGYDSKRTGQKIITDIKKEKIELQDIFQKKEQRVKNQQKELNTDEFFNFD